MIDIPLVRQAVRTGKPIIISTGMSSIEEIKEVFDENRLSLKIKEEIPPKDVGIKVKCFAIKMKGWIGNPTEDQTKMILTIHDNTDTADDEYGLPVCSVHPAFMEREGKSRVFGVNTIWNKELSKVCKPLKPMSVYYRLY